MSSFRQQMQQLAEKIANSRVERKACISRCEKSREQLRIDVERQRDQIRSELDKQARLLDKELSDFNHNNQKTVSRALRDNRVHRTSQAKAFHSRLRQEVTNNKRYIARTLRQNGTERKRVQRQLERSAKQTIQSVKQQVQRICNATNRMTRAWSNDRFEAKRIWARIQLGAAQSGTPRVPHRTENVRTNAHNETIKAPVVTVTSDLSSAAVSSSGLALPPTR